MWHAGQRIFDYPYHGANVMEMINGIYSLAAASFKTLLDNDVTFMAGDFDFQVFYILFLEIAARKIT